MSETSQPSGTPDGGGSTTPADPTSTGQENNGGQTPPATPPATSQGVDLKALEGDQLNQVLENPNLWKNPRLAGLLDSDKKLKQLQKEKDDAENKSLAEQNKWKELATKHEQENQTLQQKLQDNSKDQALSAKLYQTGVVDLDAALKLIDKNKVIINDSGQVEGVDEAIESLKTEKPYLFSESGSAPNVGSPSNPSGPSTGTPGRYKFKESQLTPEFYKEHKAEIDEAGRLGQIEPDGPPQA